MDDQAQGGLSYVPSMLEYLDSDDSEESSTHSELSFSSPPASPLTSADNLTDFESEESEYPDSESSEWSSECSESSNIIAPCLSPLTPLNIVDEAIVMAFPVAESPQQLQAPAIPVVSSQLPTNNVSSTSANSSRIETYKLVGDNIDFSVKARFSRSDSPKDQSLHYFHFMCVHDRIDFNEFSSEKAISCLNSAEKMAEFLLPTKECDNQLANHLAVLVSHIIVSHMSYFDFSFSDVVTWHINHPHYEEMSKRSEVVSSFAFAGKVIHKLMLLL